VGITSRRGVSAQALAEAIAMASDALALEAGAQWAALRKVHAPIGWRAPAAHGPRVMGILQRHARQFSDGGRFLDKPDAAIDMPPR
jgi:dihydropteroate synthase